MVIDPTSILQFLLSIILFPTLFQDGLLEFVWGAQDPVWMMVVKRVFLLLPTVAVVAACWASVPSLVTVIFRNKRSQFITGLFLTWWDLGKAVMSFWGGILLFCVNLLWATLGFLRFVFLSLWTLLQDVLFLPIRIVRKASQSVVRSNVPWIAVFLTLFWCMIEALIFSYVVSPLVVDTLSNITGDQLSMSYLRIPLFIFLLFVVLGSYAVLSTLIAAAKRKEITGLIGIAVIELVVMFVEVVFLYREFVDSLVPWFAQYSEGFELGIFWTLAIACVAWLGIRSVSWFLFASHGTPTILSVIQGKGLGIQSTGEPLPTPPPSASARFIDKLKEEADWVKAKGDELLASFMLPPLQVVAATINFFTLLVNGNHLFQLPFKRFGDILASSALLEDLVPKNARRALRAEATKGA
jgi:hypothetical protein